MLMMFFNGAHPTVDVVIADGWYEVRTRGYRVTRFRSLARAERCARRVAEMLP